MSQEIMYEAIATPTHQSPHAALWTDPSDTAPHPRVLLAEDNVVNQKFALLCLKKIGATCEVATNGQEAADLYAQQHHDVVLMDIHMPDVDGYQGLQAIREIDPQAVVIAVTATIAPEGRETFVRQGFDHYLPKPFTLDQLRQVIHNAQQLRSQRHAYS